MKNRKQSRRNSLKNRMERRNQVSLSSRITHQKIRCVLQIMIRPLMEAEAVLLQTQMKIHLEIQVKKRSKIKTRILNRRHLQVLKHGQMNIKEMNTKDFKIKLAGKVIDVKHIFPDVREYCREYITEGQADFFIEISRKDILFEKRKSAHEDEVEGIPVRQFSDGYLEILAVYRKIVEKLIDDDILLFHGSAIAFDDDGYLFTAKSGVGKSTHARLWRRQFGERVRMLNDDKPLLKITDNGVIVYGTPWDGKHRLNSNSSAPLKAICILKQDVSNHIEQMENRSAYPFLLQQIYRSSNPDKIMKTLTLLDKLLDYVGIYQLGCTMDSSAAITAYKGMKQ